MMKNILIALLLLPEIILGIEVGGHITQNTIWSPDQNPYVVTSYLYVDPGVTLTIQPGVHVYIVGADKNDIYNFMWSGNDQPIAKMIIVNGRIEAIGTAADPITFNKYGQGADIRWGGIYMSPAAPMSTFEFCEFRNSFFCDYVPGQWSLSVLTFENGMIIVRNCVFENNYSDLWSSNIALDLLIYRCRFNNSDNDYPPPFGYGAIHIAVSAPLTPAPPTNYKLTIANCYFTGEGDFCYGGYHTDALFLNNFFENFEASYYYGDTNRSDIGSSSAYGNLSINGKQGWGCSSATPTDTVFARRNRLIKTTGSGNPLTIGGSGYGTNHVSDNYLYGRVQVNTSQSNLTTNYIYNNVVETTYFPAVYFGSYQPQLQPGQMRFFNNLVTYIGTYTYALIMRSESCSPYVYNNTINNFSTLHSSSGVCDEVLANNILDFTYWSVGGMSLEHHPMLYNNCLSMPIVYPWDMVDGGGNIVADPMFADSLNGDYSLQQGSPCIDAGMIRPDLPAFDIRYHHRVRAGSENGPRAVDIGAYEYNSVYIGGIQGYVYDSASGLPVDCAKLEIIGKLPEFTDTLGCFQYPSGAGTYTLKVSRWDYSDLVLTNVTVAEGEDTVLNIPLQLETVGTEDETAPVSPAPVFISVYPNPFRRQTTLSYTLPEKTEIGLAIYNIKGQKIRTLFTGSADKGMHTVKWDETDENGKSCSSGVYFAIMKYKGGQISHKMILMK